MKPKDTIIPMEETGTRASCKECCFYDGCINDRFNKECPCKNCVINTICEKCCGEAHNYFQYRFTKMGGE